MRKQADGLTHALAPELYAVIATRSQGPRELAQGVGMGSVLHAKTLEQKVQEVVTRSSVPFATRF